MSLNQLLPFMAPHRAAPCSPNRPKSPKPGQDKDDQDNSCVRMSNGFKRKRWNMLDVERHWHPNVWKLIFSDLLSSLTCRVKLGLTLHWISPRPKNKARKTTHVKKKKTYPVLTSHHLYCNRPETLWPPGQNPTRANTVPWYRDLPMASTDQTLNSFTSRG